MLNLDEVRKLAKLARIELLPDEEQKFAKEISAILGFAEQLQEIKLDESAQLAGPTANNLRPDAVIGLSLDDQQNLIDQAPEVQDNLIKTKPIF